MRITCPKCQFQGLIDAAPLAFETRVACVRCGETFEALLIEGEILTSLPLNEVEQPMAQVNAPDSAAQDMNPSSDVEDVLALPHAPTVEYQFNEQTPVLEDVLHVIPVDVELEAQEHEFTNPVEALAVVRDESVPQSLNESPLPAAEFGDEHSLKFDQPLAESAAEYDKQSVGMRLMSISPLWLLVCGVTFVSVIILSNQFARSASQGPHVAMNYAAPGNRATNQALPQPPAPNVSQIAAPASSELKDDAKAIEGKAGVEVRDEPKPAPSVAPVAETKKAEVVPVPVPQSRGESGGGFTVQVGSYNVIEQANERVARLQSAGFDARVAVVELPKRGTWYRVQAGRFSSREEASRYGNELRAKGGADNFIIAEVAGGK